MPGENEQFKFPDEQDPDKSTAAGAADEIEIEIEDDTPAKDRGRQPLGREVQDPTEEEIEAYSDKVKARINELTHARHDERRAKEALAREKEELERVAQQLLAENQTLKKTVHTGQETIISSAKARAEAELEAARKELRAAHEAFDTDAIVAAQEKLSEAKIRMEQVKNFRPTPLQEAPAAVQPAQPQPQQVRPDEKSLRWQAKNQWFGQPGFEEYTSYALGLHQKLVQGGVSPGTDDYFEQIDSRMKSTFPDLFKGADTKAKPEDVKRPATTVVAPATRSASVGKIRLTATQVALAKRLGLTPQQYAVQVAKLESQNV
jgi:DNA-binding Lrp family transcriptional regulator